jgi:hypothetical protein
MTLVGEAEIGGVRGLLAPLVRSRQERDVLAHLQRIKMLLEAKG